MGKLSLCWHTVKYLRPEQIVFRITKKMNINCSLGVRGHIGEERGKASLLPQLDFDPVFLKRFPVEELMQNRVTLLHETEEFSWNSPWRFERRSDLWHYNLHYCEYLLPLVNTWLETKQIQYLDKIKEIIWNWIIQNPKDKGGSGWDAYPISLRLIVWLNCYGYLEQDLDKDFQQEMLASMAEQYAHLATHLEKHLLGNHYFENLKTLVICSLFFRDDAMTEAAQTELRKQCKEQILPDGMHFELSPMYHKIILEDLFRVCVALRQTGRPDEALEACLQPMVDVAYSLEEGLERIPLFNDCGNNVAKSLDTLLLIAKEEFGIEPVYKSQLPDSGYYIFKNGDWKLIVDAGQPCPSYLPGHAHCDAMSFELFHKGKPILVNCGTYAYQCQERGFFRSTAAHNTVMCNGNEQSDCWSAFRMGKRSRCEVLDCSKQKLLLRLYDKNNCVIQREFSFGAKGMEIRDSGSCDMDLWLHVLPECRNVKNDIVVGGELRIVTDFPWKLHEHPYAYDFGRIYSICGMSAKVKNYAKVGVIKNESACISDGLSE